MSDFHVFEDSELSLIVSLPVRVGAWIARQDDDVRSTRDEQREVRALTAVIEELSKINKSPFAAELAQRALGGRSLWGGWMEMPEDRLFSDVTRACHMVDQRMPQGTGKAFRSALWRVARAVAMAYGESEAENASENMFSTLVRNLVGKLESATPDDPTHVSPSEAQALKKLKAALQS
jgi:hypothetical protein